MKIVAPQELSKVHSIVIIVMILSIVLALSACSVRPVPASVEFVSTMIVSTPTSVRIPTTTSIPTATATALQTTSTLDFRHLVAGVLVNLWKDIPVMPGAISGIEKNGVYIYVTTALADDVTSFYAHEMPKGNWTPRKSSGTPEPSGIITLVFVKGPEVCMVGIIPENDGRMVMLGRQVK